MSLANNLLNTYNNLNNRLVEQSDLITQISEALATKISPTAKEEQEKTINTQAYTDTSITIEPDEGKTLSKVTVNIDVKEEQEKTVNITSNGITSVLPDTGKTLSKVNITTNIQSSGDITEERSMWVNRTLTEFTDNNLSVIKGATFGYCDKLSAVNVPLCTSVGDYAFINCSSLKSIDMPLCTSIGASAFCGCKSLSIANIPSCITVGSNAFQYCTSLTSVNIPACSNVAYSMFGNCSSLLSIDLPVCSTVGGYAFAQCYSLSLINLPMCTTINYGAIRYCSSLSFIDLPVCKSLNGDVFNGCIKLESIILRHSDVVTLTATSAFQSTPLSASSYIGTFGSIYVPASLVNAYKSATNWTAYANRITAIIEISDIDDIDIAVNSTKSYEIQLEGFNSIPENITIVPNDENKLSISNIQSTNDKITFNVTTNTTISENDIVVSLSYNGKTYSKSFKINIISAIGDIEDKIFVPNNSRTVSIPWYGDTTALNVSITSNNTNLLSISNIQSNTNYITFDTTTYNNDGVVNIAISYIYKNITYTKSYQLTVKNIPFYTVETLGTDYTFILNNNGYYESNNKGQKSSFAICKVNINAPYDCKMYVDCINYAENGWDYGILSERDQTLELNSGADVSNKQTFKNASTPDIQTVVYDIPAGKHFIYIKFIKDGSQDKYNDSLQFSIRFK